MLWMVYVQSMAAYLKCGTASDTVDYVMLAACAIMALSKMIALRVHMPKIRQITTTALNDWLSVDASNIRDILIPFAKSGRTAFYVQMVSSYISNTLIIIGTLPFLMPPPMATNGTSWNNTSNETSSMMPSRELPLKTGCMFAESRDEIYAFLYVYESITIMLTAHGNVGCDVFLYSLAMHICGQIELLKSNATEIGEKSEKFSLTQEKIAQFVERHCELLHLTDCLNTTVSGMLVVQLLLNAGLNLMLGIRVILAVNSGMPFDAVRPIVAFNVLMLQLYLLSYASDRLSQQAESIIDAIYDCGWYELPAKFRRSLYFVLMRSSKSIYMRAGQFYDINIENFKNILKASFSYFSILRVMFDAE